MPSLPAWSDKLGWTSLSPLAPVSSPTPHMYTHSCSPWVSGGTCVWDNWGLPSSNVLYGSFLNLACDIRGQSILCCLKVVPHFKGWSATPPQGHKHRLWDSRWWDLRQQGTSDPLVPRIPLTMSCEPIREVVGGVLTSVWSFHKVFWVWGVQPQWGSPSSRHHIFGPAFRQHRPFAPWGLAGMAGQSGTDPWSTECSNFHFVEEVEAWWVSLSPWWWVDWRRLPRLVQGLTSG